MERDLKKMRGDRPFLLPKVDLRSRPLGDFVAPDKILETLKSATARSLACLHRFRLRAWRHLEIEFLAIPPAGFFAFHC